MTFNWFKKKDESEIWYQEQIRLLESGSEIEPPWVAFKDAEPYHFKQGWNEAWLHDVFLKFWKTQSAELKSKYLEKWKPPNEHWDECLRKLWNEPLK